MPEQVLGPWCCVSKWHCHRGLKSIFSKNQCPAGLCPHYECNYDFPHCTPSPEAVHPLALHQKKENRWEMPHTFQYKPECIAHHLCLDTTDRSLATGSQWTCRVLARKPSCGYRPLLVHPVCCQLWVRRQWRHTNNTSCISWVRSMMELQSLYEVDGVMQNLNNPIFCNSLRYQLGHGELSLF